MTAGQAHLDPFAEQAAGYETWFDTPLGGYIDRVELAALDELLPPPGANPVVEVGAGTGHISRHLTRRGYHMLAVEPSRAMRAEGFRRRDASSPEWIAGAAERLPLRDGSPDGVLFFAVLEFVDDAGAALREAFRVTRPGGWVAAGVLHAHSSWVALYRALAETGMEPWRSARFFTPEQVETVAGAAAVRSARAAFLAPGAEPPFEVADKAGRRAGNAPALEILLWRKPE